MILIISLFLMSCGQSTTHRIDFSLCSVYDNKEDREKCFEILLRGGKPDELKKDEKK